MNNDLIHVTDNLEQMYIDIKQILYSGLGNTNKITFSKDIGGDRPRTAHVSVDIQYFVQYHNENE